MERELFRDVQRWLRVIVLRRYGADKKLGHRKYHRARLRSKEVLEGPNRELGPDFINLRRRIKSYLVRFVLELEDSVTFQAGSARIAACKPGCR